MKILATDRFQRQVVDILTDEELEKLKSLLEINPGIGILIKGGNGLRKLRWRMEGRGKSGGARVIYYWALTDEIIYLLSIYDKHKQEDVPKDELNYLKRLIEGE